MSAQAVGGAVGHNPISIIVPCHRVVGIDGSLTGYAGGIDKKDVNNEDDSIKCIAASQYLKRSTDSLKHAVENDLFCTAPELHRLFEIADL